MQTRASSATNIKKDNQEKNREQITVGHGDLYSGRVSIIKEGSFVNSVVVEIRDS
jgi:hypothetical protein